MTPEIIDLPLDIHLEIADWFVFTVGGVLVLLYLIALKQKTSVKEIQSQD